MKNIERLELIIGSNIKLANDLGQRSCEIHLFPEDREEAIEVLKAANIYEYEFSDDGWLKIKWN